MVDIYQAMKRQFCLVCCQEVNCTCYSLLNEPVSEHEKHYSHVWYILISDINIINSGLVFLYTGKIFYICDPAVSMVFSCSDPPLVMTYDFVIGLHSVWHVTKATAQVRLHFITNSSICFFKVWIFLYDFEHFLWLQRPIYFVLIFICTTAPSNL